MKRIFSGRFSSISTFYSLSQTPIRPFSCSSYLNSASLYTNDALGVNSYLDSRKYVGNKFQDRREIFQSKMSEYVKDSPTNMIFTEDLKSMIYLCDSKTDDFDLIHKMMVKFHNQNSEIRFGNFNFGPIVMRMYSHHNAYNEALEVFRDEKLSGFFDQISSYLVLCNLLYKNGKYDEVIEVFERAKSKKVSMSKYPKHVVLIVFAACYKQNTPESFKYASKLWTELLDFGHQPIRKATAFFAALAINQGAPHVSIEVVSTLKLQSYVTVRNIKIMAYADLNKADSALPILRALLDVDIPHSVKNTVFKVSLDRLENAIEKSEDPDLKREYAQIIKGLHDRGMIVDQTLDDFLNQESDIKTNRGTVDNQLLASSFQNNRNSYRKLPKQGLSEMY